MGFRLILFFVLFISCNEKNCDLNYFPSPPYGPADDTIYFERSVRYLYACVSPGTNEVITYYIAGGCWENVTEYNTNLNCN